MDDLISRQEAIDIVRFECGEWRGLSKTIENSLNDLPSAEPMQKIGQWKMKKTLMDFFEEIPVCSECGHTTEMRKTYNFCPHCGADMRGEQDE